MKPLLNWSSAFLLLFFKQAKDDSANRACLTRNNLVHLTRPLSAGFTSSVVKANSTSCATSKFSKRQYVHLCAVA